MQGFEFRLEAVLKYQEKQKMLAAIRRQQALQTLHVIEAEMQRLQQELGQTAWSMARCVGRDDAAGQWQTLHAKSQWLAHLLSAQEQRMPAARAEFAKANEAHRKVASLVEGLHGMRQRRWEAYKNGTMLLEQQRLDEFVLRRWSEGAGAAQDEQDGKDAP